MAKYPFPMSTGECLSVLDPSPSLPLALPPHAHKRSLVSIAKLWCHPALIVLYLPLPNCRGVFCVFAFPKPTCPYLDQPHTYKLSLLHIAKLWASPALIALYLLVPIWRGISTSAPPVIPLPSPAPLFLPHVYKWPSSFNAILCWYPAAIATNLLFPCWSCISLGAGWSFLVPSPTWPCWFLPHPHNCLLVSIAKLWLSPVATAINLKSPIIGSGRSLESLFPVPSRPLAPPPHTQSLPLLSMYKVWLNPAAILFAGGTSSNILVNEPVLRTPSLTVIALIVVVRLIVIGPV
jgi:hypothetical protein